ncbi:MAG TPA: hypothetical protein VGI03_11830 [Verrucomicrobiae bacterium]|jgi:hypothetical protein
MRTRLILPALLAALALLAMPARANLTFSLTPAALPGSGSNEVIFIGTFTNNSLTNLYLNNIQFSFTNAATNYLAGDTNFFFQNIPGIFSSNQTYSDVAMGVYINPSAPVGIFSGTASVAGGGDELATNDLADVSFQISLVPPSVAIAATGTNLMLTWPVPPGGFIVLQNSNLVTGTWTTNSDPIFTNGTTEGVNVTPGAGNLFFQLNGP